MAERRLINPANWPYFDYSKMPYSLAAEKNGILYLSGRRRSEKTRRRARLSAWATRWNRWT